MSLTMRTGMQPEDIPDRTVAVETIEKVGQYAIENVIRYAR